MTIKQTIHSPIVSETNGIASAIKVGDFIYTSMILPTDVKGEIVIEKQQLEQCFKNLRYILNQVGIGFQSVMSITISYTKKDTEETILNICNTILPKPLPAISYYGVSFLSKNACFALSCIAIDTRELESVMKNAEQGKGQGGCNGCGNAKGCSGCHK